MLEPASCSFVSAQANRSIWSATAINLRNVATSRVYLIKQHMHSLVLGAR